MASGGPLRELCEETTCPICLQFFQDPVILAQCGHTFCRLCLTQWTSNSPTCPQCKKTGSPKGDFSPNWPLASIVAIAQRLEEAQREEVEKAKRGRCAPHQAPLHFFCKEDQTAVCWVCNKSDQHKFHKVVPVEEVEQHYQEKLQEQLKYLKKEKEHLFKKIKDEELGRQACLALLQEEKKKIESPFEKIHTFLEEKLNVSLASLKELEEEAEEKHKARVAILSAESSHLTDLIKEVETKCQQSPSEFLQDIGSTLDRCNRKPVGYMVNLPLQMQERIRIYSQKTSDLETIMNICKESLESIETEPTKVNVTLDEDTAHPSLVLSSNPESVIVGGTGLFLPDNPERFEFMHCVLGCEAFDSGNHWWEVEVTLQQKKKAMWAVGVAIESVKRKGLFLPCPDEGIWAVGKLKGASPSHLLAFTSPKLHPLILRRNLCKIRVSLNYEEKCVKFFDANTNKVIFVFGSATFSGKKVRPYFSLWRGAKLSC